jgi:membrane-associated phospholipid phosphatase
MRRIGQSLYFVSVLLWLTSAQEISFGQSGTFTPNEVAALVTDPSEAQEKPTNSPDKSASGSDSTPSPSKDTSQPAQPSSASSSGFRDFVGTFLSDEKNIWTSPLKAKPKDLYWLLPLAGATAAFLATDTDISNGLPNTQHQINLSRDLSQLGSAYTLYGASAAFYLIGRHKDNDRLRETGWLSIMAITHSQIVVEALKLATGRERPEDNSGQGRFWKGKDGFPSGHAISSWAFASVVAEEYNDNKLVQVGAYSMATLVSVCRVTGRRHYPSDVLVGSSMGFLIGRYMVHAHHDTSDFTGRPKLRSLLSPQASPSFDRSSKSYGATLNWRF